MAKTFDGYLLIADITGYTQYLSESELEHAQDTLAALLELLVDQTRPPLILSRLAGDAVISYGLRERFFHGQSFVEKIEDTYVTFRQALERLVLNNTCQCNACANIGSLDLKFFIHYGTFGIQRISDHDELVGTDVNVIHRLLKNEVNERTGFRAYALYTEMAISQLGVEDLTSTMTPHTEEYIDVGEIHAFVQDMHPVWEAKREAVAVEFPTDRILDHLEVEIELPREQVWDYLIQPEYRSALIGSDWMEVTNRSQGRIAPGSVYQCYHGDKVVPQTILEWQPFERMLVKELTPMSASISFLADYRLESTERGTLLSKTVSRPTAPLSWRLVVRLLTPLFNRMNTRSMETFAKMIEADSQGLDPPELH